MSNPNEINYLNALHTLKDKDSKSDDIEFCIYPSAIMQIETIMKNMEWDISVTVNSCLTYTLSVRKNIDFSLYKQLDKTGISELITPGLTIKNEDRIKSIAKNNNLEFDEHFLSFILTESVNEFFINFDFCD